MTTMPQATHYDVARYNMIEQQIRPWDVLDPKVLDLFNEIPRENFVCESQQGLVFADIELPLGYGQTMLSPKLEGRILQTLAIKKTDRVLEIGTGSGYFTALLAATAKHVDSVEIIPELSQFAAKRLKKQGVNNVTLHLGDASQTWATGSYYDVIVFTGSLPILPAAYQDKLSKGGVIFAVIGQSTAMQAILIHRMPTGNFRQEVVFETWLPQLKNAQQITKFEF